MGKGEAAFIRAQAEAEAAKIRATGEAKAAKIRATGAAKAEAYKLGANPLGEAGFVATQMASILGENRVKLFRISRSAETEAGASRTCSSEKCSPEAFRAPSLPRRSSETRAGPLAEDEEVGPFVQSPP